MREQLKAEDIVGKRYGRLTVLSTYLFRGIRSSRRYVICKCDCGNEVKTRYDAVTSGKTTSCGCYHREICKKNSTLYKKISK